MEPLGCRTLFNRGLVIASVLLLVIAYGIISNGVRIEASSSGASIAFGPTATPTMVPSPTPDAKLEGLVPWVVDIGMCDTQHGQYWVVNDTYPNGVCYGPPMDIPVYKGAPMTLFEFLGSNIWTFILIAAVALALIFLALPRPSQEKNKNDWEKPKNVPQGGGGGFIQYKDPDRLNKR